MPPYIKIALKAIFIFAVMLYGYHAVKKLYTDVGAYQWDFQVYYHAAKVHAAGGNPYDVSEIEASIGKDWILGYVYPPAGMYLFKPFLALAPETAMQVWLTLKLILLFALIAIWQRYFIPDIPVWILLPVLVFAFSSAVYWDLKSGNVSIIEQFFLWTGFVFLLKDRPLGFCGAVLLASLFKGLPLVFLPLLLFTDDRRRWYYVGGALLAFVLYAGVNAIAFPNLTHEYLARAIAIGELGSSYNFSLLALVTDILRYFWLGSPPLSPVVAYLLIAGLLVLITVYALRKRFRPIAADRLLLILLYCVLFALVAPRFKSYSFILLIPPALYVLSNIRLSRASLALVVLLIIPERSPLPIFVFTEQFKVYLPYVQLLVIWGLYLVHARERIHDTNSTMRSPGNVVTEHD